MATENKCFFFNGVDGLIHEKQGVKGLREFVDNTAQCRRLVCKECYGVTSTCALCGMFHDGRTLELAAAPTCLLDAEAENTGEEAEKLEYETYCVECVNTNLPELMVRMFRDDFDALEEFFGEYHVFRCKDTLDRLDCSTIETIRIKVNGEVFDAKQPTLFACAMSDLAKIFKGIRTFLRDVFIAELRQQKRDEQHPVQLAYDERVREGLATLTHFLPASQNQSRAHELLPRRFIRGFELEHRRFSRMTTQLSLAKIRDNNDFNSFLDFLSGR